MVRLPFGLFTLPPRTWFGQRLVLLLACVVVGLSIRFWFTQPGPGVNSTLGSAPILYNPLADQEYQAAARLRDSGNLTKAAFAFDRLAAAARKGGNKAKETRALLAEGSVQLRQFAYRDAMQTYYKVLDLADSLKDERSMGAAYVNLAEIHLQLNDIPAAEREAGSAVNILKSGQYVDVLLKALLQLGSIKADLGQNGEAREAYEKAIELAADADRIDDESLAWLILGQALANTNDLDQAESAYLNAYRLGVLQHASNIDSVRAKLAELEWKRGNTADSLKRLHSLFASTSPAKLGVAEHQAFFLQAEMLAAVGRDAEALEAYRKAVAAATRWRQGALPGEVANAGSVQSIHAVYAGASDFLAHLAKVRSNDEFAREALEILAINRAVDLREQRTLAWHRDGRLPSRYYQLLTQLRTAEVSSILADTGRGETDNLVRQTRADLSLMETQLAMQSGNSSQSEESFHSQKRLVDIQQALAQNDALFSFSLGKQRSWLWVVTNHSIHLSELPNGPSLERSAAEWAAKVRSGEDASMAGYRFAQALLSDVPRAVFNKRNWLVVNDGALFINVPLSALPDIARENTVTPALAQWLPIPLVQNHTIRYLSSEFSLSTHQVKFNSSSLFAGIGDPVYNLADGRYSEVKAPAIRQQGTVATTTLARLVGSGAEVRQAASYFPKSVVLTGAKANTEQVASLFEQKPAVVHFAVHVVSPPDRPEEAALAMTLGSNHLPELLTSELIATYRVPASLIVMSGCDSQQGRPVAGVGVKGLSRAWLLAGAEIVVTSTWPMPDDDGLFFRSFYQHLTGSAKAAGSLPELAATALAEAQNDMRATTNFRHNPSFWAAYTVISKE